MIRYTAASCRVSDANTTVAAADNDDDDDASQCDVIATHPEHLLLSSMDSCPATRFVRYFIIYSTLDSARSLYTYLGCRSSCTLRIVRRGQKLRCSYEGWKNTR